MTCSMIISQLAMFSNMDVILIIKEIDETASRPQEPKYQYSPIY